MIIIIAIFVLLILFYTIKSLILNKTHDRKLAFIVVLGDIGRSPRMNYHCLSLVKLGYHVIFIGYKESKQLDEIENNPNVKITPLRSFPAYLQVGPQLLQYGLKAFYLSFALLFTLFQQKKIPSFVLVQNPPSIPTLTLVHLYCYLVKTKFIIDWHNYGFTILALKKNAENRVVKLCKKIELYFGAKSDLNFCVTEALKIDLEKYGIKAITMHDKAHERFRLLDLHEKHKFYLKLADKYKLTSISDKDKNTIFTEKNEDNVCLKENRPAILVSSSSWTEDEDFHLLIEAFEIYQKSPVKTDIVCFLTGKGPLKEYYENLFKEKSFENIHVYFLWLDPGDYPLLLGSSDLGVCFHKSSSNLDLPMKVVDMFGCRLPTCAFNFSCISELVKENVNGLLFNSGQELAAHLQKLLSNLNEKESQLESFRNNLKDFSSWSDEWENKIKPELSLF